MRCARYYSTYRTLIIHIREVIVLLGNIAGTVLGIAWA